ncbi:MAG: A/G-specific adenine glycosylase [Myxococcota bacterium]|nr:A/G-specific adenine glycosylase [Myxococcota bacterium]
MDARSIETFQRQLLTWYGDHHRRLPWRETRDPYAIWISEVMLQQTQVATAIAYYKRFLARFPDVQSLAEAPLQEVLKHWEGLGYYARARNLHRAARVMLDSLGGIVPNSPEAFQRLPGVGPYICAAVQSIAFGHPLPVVDGNVKRVVARLFLLDQPANTSATHSSFLTAATELLQTDRPGTFNQAMMELGAIICTPQAPQCHVCPVATACQAQSEQMVQAYPKRMPRRRIPTHHLVTGVVFKKDRVLITKRNPEGLLGGLWEFPGGQIEPEESPKMACCRQIRDTVGLDVHIRRHLTQVKHAYTHFKIVMDVYICAHASGRVRLQGPVDFEWVCLRHLSRFPFSRAYTKFISLLDPVVIDEDYLRPGLGCR